MGNRLSPYGRHNLISHFLLSEGGVASRPHEERSKVRQYKEVPYIRPSYNDEGAF